MQPHYRPARFSGRPLRHIGGRHGPARQDRRSFKPLRPRAAPAAGSMGQPHAKSPAADHSAPAMPIRHVVSACAVMSTPGAEQTGSDCAFAIACVRETFLLPRRGADNRIDVKRFERRDRLGAESRMLDSVCRAPVKRRHREPNRGDGTHISLAGWPAPHEQWYWLDLIPACSCHNADVPRRHRLARGCRRARNHCQ
jgi:hypothetical protein